MIQLNQATKQLLHNINFSERYEKLVSDFSDSIYLDKLNYNEVSNVLKRLSISNFAFDKKEELYTLEKVNGDPYLEFKISVKHSVVEFILAFGTDNKSYSCGGNFGVINMLMGSKKGFKKPAFSNYEDLEEILRKGGNIYKDLKSELLKATKK